MSALYNVVSYGPPRPDCNEPHHLQMATDHPYLGQLGFRVKQKVVTECKNDSKAFSATLVAKAEMRVRVASFQRIVGGLS